MVVKLVPCTRFKTQKYRQLRTGPVRSLVERSSSSVELVIKCLRSQLASLAGACSQAKLHISRVGLANSCDIELNTRRKILASCIILFVL